MSQFSLSNFLAFLTTFFLAFFVYFANQRSKINRIFCLYSLSISVWSFCTALHALTASESISFIAAKSMNIGVPFIPIFFFHFCIVILNIHGKFNRAMLFAGYILSSIIIVINFTTNLIVPQVRPKLGYDYFMEPGLFYPILILTFLAYTTAGLYLLMKASFISTGSRRNQITYLFWGSLLGYGFGISCFLPVYNIVVFPYPFGSYGIIAYVFITTYAIVRHRLMDIKVAVTRAGIFAFIYLCVLGLPFGIGFKLLEKGLWVLPVSIMGMLATMGPFIYNHLRRQAENRLLAEELKNHETLKRLARSLPLIHELDDITKLIVYRLVKNLKVAFAAIYLYDEESDSCILKSQYSYKAFNSHFLSELPSKNDFIKFIIKHKKDFLYEDAQRLIQEERPNNKKENNENNHVDLSKVVSFMKDTNIALVIPNFLENNLIGFVAMGHKTSGKHYSQEDIELLTTLSRSASLSILNALFSIELRKTEQELADTHRAAQLGYLASSIGHQVGNVLQNIAHITSGLLCNPLIIELFKDKPKLYTLFEKHINDIFTNVEDGGMIVAEIRDYAQRDQDKQFVPINLKEVLDKALKILYIPQAKFHTIDVVINISADVPHVLGSSVQLQNVFINICNNCYDATQEMKAHIQQHPELGIADYKGKIEIDITRQKGKVHIHTIDNGMGMPQEIQKRLFTPLYTTKASFEKRKEQKLSGGTGIGLYTILVIIKRHGGTIRLYKTKPLKGSDFLIELPIPKEGGK